MRITSFGGVDDRVLSSVGLADVGLCLCHLASGACGSSLQINSGALFQVENAISVPSFECYNRPDVVNMFRTTAKTAPYSPTKEPASSPGGHAEAF